MFKSHLIITKRAFIFFLNSNQFECKIQCNIFLLYIQTSRLENANNDHVIEPRIECVKLRF